MTLSLPTDEPGQYVALEAKLVDLLPVVKRYVYHPDFGGSVGIKAVLPALVEGMRYGDLVRIADGGEASAKLERLWGWPRD